MRGKHGIATALGVGALSLTLASTGCAWRWHEHERHEKPTYTSSVQVTRTERAERGEHRRRQEAAALAKVAKIDLTQAISAAVAQVPGTVLSARIENEDGNVVYAVDVLTAAGARKDVTVDAGNAAVLRVSDERGHCDKD